MASRRSFVRSIVAMVVIATGLTLEHAEAGSNCCFANGGLGCDNPACESAVCAVDFLCCVLEWDSICADEAATLCAICMPASNCCIANGGTGCDDPACEDLVCAVDTFCCTVAWDSVCSSQAADLCSVCGGGPVECPWDCDGSGDGNVNVTDLLTLLAQWDAGSPLECTGGTCDYNGDGCIDVLDLLKFLAHLTPDPAGFGCPK